MLVLLACSFFAAEQRDNVGGSTAQTEDDRAGADNQVEILDGLMGYLKGSLGV